MYNPFSLEGKTVLVTGASSGIGKATAIECSKFGAKVFLSARNEERLKQTLAEMDGDGHVIIKADITCIDDIQNIADRVDAFDGVALVAGINDKMIIKRIDDDFIGKMMSTNLVGPALLMKSLLKARKINKQASIVFMSSVSAFYPSISNALYGASKAALNQFAKVLALEVLPLQARVNCIQPAFVETEMIQKYGEETLEEIRKNYPLGRFAQPEEVAKAIIYYFSDATQLITGTSLVIDGGYTLR